MSEIKHFEYRVEYLPKLGDCARWQQRPNVHGNMAEAVQELAHISDCKCYDFRIVKREVTEWEVVE